jgi:hypothetical protein
MVDIAKQYAGGQVSGWLGVEAAKAAREALAEHWSPFVLHDEFGAVVSGERVDTFLWQYAKKANGGEHLANIPQQIGDCVSFGAAHAVDYLACMEIVRLGEAETYRPAFPPYIYGISRVQIGGGRIGGDGSVGAWGAAGLQKYGVLAANEAGVPPYSGRVARAWGDQGPPAAMIERARPHLIKSAANVASFEQIADALCNGYPTTVASDRGFDMQPVLRDGRRWGVPRGSWAHQMCFIGVIFGSRPGCYCLNSWGPDAHGPPAQDEPPGGFWVEAEVVTSMARQGDAFALSQFNGFPRQRLHQLY